MNNTRAEQRQFSRVALDLPVDVHQGGSIWQLRLIDLNSAIFETYVHEPVCSFELKDWQPGTQET